MSNHYQSTVVLHLKNTNFKWKWEEIRDSVPQGSIFGASPFSHLCSLPPKYVPDNYNLILSAYDTTVVVNDNSGREFNFKV